MDPTNYQRLAELTENKDFDSIVARMTKTVQLIRLLHAAQGLCTEAGEFTDAIKKHIFYGKTLDLVNLEEEIGDAMWYIAEACNAIGVDLGEVMALNIKKLRTRYPERFTEEKAVVRDLDAERKILEENDE
jgi:NTP pyrophosphatase (non-canonical NTP hydrolase)